MLVANLVHIREQRPSAVVARSRGSTVDMYLSTEQPVATASSP